MNSKEYKLPNGKKAVFEYDITGVGKITLECMDELMGMIADRPQGEWTYHMDEVGNVKTVSCALCGGWVDITIPEQTAKFAYCPYCGARMKGADDEIATV